MPGLAATETWRGTLAPESIRVAQLEPGDLFLDRSMTELNSLRVVSLNARLGFEGHSDLLPGKTVLGVIADRSTDARWFGERVDSAAIVATHTSMDLTTHGCSKMLFVATDTGSLGPADGCRIHRSPENAERFRSYLGAAIRFSRVGRNERLCRQVEQTLRPLLASCLSDSKPCPTPSALTRRVAAVRQCEAYVRERIDEIPTLSELCAISGLQPRSLINAFQAVTGMSPMTYLRVRRLNEVHVALTKLDPDHTRIIDVAANWGFWHMGHFTASYRGMFGETPSETLNRRRAIVTVD